MEREMWEKELNRWLESPLVEEKTKGELRELLGKGEEGNLILKDMFYHELTFGTGGLRGKLGPGANRMNIHTVKKTTLGLSNYIINNNLGTRVAISYDSRNMSKEFSEIAKEALMDSGLDVYLYDTLMPAPSLSFAVRYHKCAMGIMITASHNPKEYNGYKVYNNRGCQVTEEEASKILKEISKTEWFSENKNHRKGRLTMMGRETKNAYYDRVSEESTGVMCDNLSLVYTPLNGTGLEPVKEMARRKKVRDFVIVKEQEAPDGNFPTCPYPNPEKKETLKLAIELAVKQNIDVVLATDPDCDRVGISVAHNGSYILPTGNETGLLLSDYLLSKVEGKTDNLLLVRTIVTSPLLDLIAKNYGARVEKTLTGFKYIGELIGKLEDEGREKEYLFGFEESYGYLKGTYVRDKDGVNAAMLIMEMAAYYKEKGLTLIDRLEYLYKTYGYYKNGLLDYEFPGIKGMEEMRALMRALREKPLDAISGLKVIEVYDYIKGGKLPPSDVLEFLLPFENKVIIRPSGTEPKLKIYLFGKGESEEEAEDILKRMEAFFNEYIKGSEKR